MTIVDGFDHRILVLIPARGGSKGLPGKNVREFVGHPLIAHTIAFAQKIPCVGRVVVSTDSEEIAEIAVRYGAEVPFIRPKSLAGDTSPMISVIKHAVQSLHSDPFDLVALLDPTSPARRLIDFTEALTTLENTQSADGAVSCSEPTFNPYWVGVRDVDGFMQRASIGGAYTRRQDVPRFLRINGSLYLWRRDFLESCDEDWIEAGNHVLIETPELFSHSIDTLEDMLVLQTLIEYGLVDLESLSVLRTRRGEG